LSVSPNRRKSPRVDVNGLLDCQDLRSGRQVHIIDVSLGGMLVETDSSIALGTVRAFRIHTRDESWVTALSAKIVHCTRRERHRAAPVYIWGCAFGQPDAEETQRRIFELLDHAAPVLSFI
jgi:PilZ domain